MARCAPRSTFPTTSIKWRRHGSGYLTDLSETIADLLRRALRQDTTSEITRSARTGLPVIHLGTVVTTDDVRSLEDDE
jgi:hypothetical protein